MSGMGDFATAAIAGFIGALITEGHRPEEQLGDPDAGLSERSILHGLGCSGQEAEVGPNTWAAMAVISSSGTSRMC